MARPTTQDHTDTIAGLLQAALETPRTELVSLGDALGRVTGEDVHSPVDLPLFRNSQMDGFAVHAADIAAVPARLQVVGEVAAGPVEPPLIGASGRAVRIMTGAPLPEDADAVVPVEDTTADGEWIVIDRSRSVGEYVRERGSDVHTGDLLLLSGVRLASRHLGALAAAGIASVLVRARLRVAILTTGSELVAAGQQPQPGQIFDANGIALEAAAQSAGAEVVSRTHVTDDRAAMEAALTAAVARADLVVTTGGISMGDYEVVRQVLEPRGAVVTTLAMQPGGPQATAVIDGIPIICLPGNPVSSQISFEVFVAPLLRAYAGLPAARRRRRTLAHDLTSVPDKRQFLRGRLRGTDDVEQVSGPGSHLVAAMATADVLIVIPEDALHLNAGESVETWAL